MMNQTLETNPHTILNGILKRNGLSTPNANILYQYQVTESEYLTILNYLKHLGFRGLSFDKDIATSAIFCLFISEWFRREYKSEYKWSWAPIWKLLGVEIESSNIKAIIFKGLKDYWKRPINQYRENHNDYLGSLFSNGGLPFKLLSSDSNRFKDLFKTLLFKYEHAQLLGQSMDQIVLEHMLRNNFPDVFTKDVTVRLISSMVEQLFILVERYKLEQNSNPADYLDKLVPDWRMGFAIPLDNHTGTLFLNDLLSTAITERKNQSSLKINEPISCSHWLSDDGFLFFYTQVTINTSFKLHEINKNDLRSFQVQVFITEGNSAEAAASFGTGYIDIENDVISVKLRTRICQFKRVNPDQPLNLNFIQHQQIIFRKEIPNSQLPLSNQPIGLHYKDDKWQVCGCGSFSYKTDSLKLIIPKIATFDSTDTDFFENEVIESFDSTHQSLVFSGVLKVSITQNIESEETEIYKISNQNMSLLSEQVDVVGKLLDYKTITGQNVYLGMPKIIIPESLNAQLYIGGKLASDNYSTAIFGLQTVKMKSFEGFTLFHKRLSILPEDFKISFTPGSTPTEGIVTIFSSKALLVSCLKKNGINSEVKRDGNLRSIYLTVNEFPPSYFVIEISANLLAEPVRLELPFPSQGILAFNALGEKLSNRISVTDLLGSRLILYPRLNTSAKYKLVLSTPTKNGPYYQTSYSVYDKPLQISLYDLKNQINKFFSLFNNIDTTLLLEISGPCKPEKFTIHKFDCGGIFENGELILDVVRKKVTKSIHPVLMHLVDPDRRPTELVNKKSENVDTDVYLLPYLPDYPSLIIPADDSELFFRPIYVQGKQIQLVKDVSSLYKAVEIFDFEENNGVIYDVLTQMSDDYNHSSWQYIIDLFTQYQHLPLSTFMVWKELSKHPAALCMLAFRVEHSHEIIERLTQEFSILWELFPLKFWQNAIDNFRLNLGLPEEIFKFIKDEKCNKLKYVISAFKEEVRDLLTYGSLTPFPKEAMNTLVNQENGYYQDLMKLHANDDWPCFYGDELLDWYLNLKIKPIDINIHHRYHAAVLILPIFVASIASEMASINILISNEKVIDDPILKYKLRQLLEFDLDWFGPIYLYCLNFLNQKD